ncbi:MAG TPA: hypothetical protein VFJ85_00230 [Acidimicrobiales bacterium]|nr:hypothetical protein [Acidimicrobiales bacterium]
MTRATATDPVETRGDRAALAAHAGLGRISAASVLAGTLAAFGAFAVLAAGVAAAARAAGFDTHRSAGQWHDIGAAGGAAAAVLLLLCFVFGGYVAGRMARRAGSTNGLLVFLLGVVVAGGLVGLVIADWGGVARNLRDAGIPTAAGQWRDVGVLAGLGSLVAMLVGALLGGAWGERWHTKLLNRAADPSRGPEGRLREAARIDAERAEEAHVESAGLVRRSAAGDRVRDVELERQAAGTHAATVSDEEIDARLAAAHNGHRT